MNRITLYDFIIDEIKGGTYYDRYYSDNESSEDEYKEDDNISKNINDNKQKNNNDEYKYDFYKFLDNIFKANSIPDNALDHMLNVPFFFEKLMSFSFLLCLDNILYDITFMPIQVVRSICLLISLFFKNASRNIMNIFYNFKNYKFYKYAVNNYKDPKKKYKVRVIKNLNKLSYSKRKETDHMYENKYMKDKSHDESYNLFKKQSRNLFSFHYLNSSRFSMNASHSDDVWVDNQLEKNINDNNINNNNNNMNGNNNNINTNDNNHNDNNHNNNSFDIITCDSVKDIQINHEHQNIKCDNINCNMKKKNGGKYFLYNRKRKTSSYNKDLKNELLKYGHKYSVLKSREDIKFSRSKTIMFNCINNNNDDYNDERRYEKKYLNNIKYLKNKIKLNYYFKYKGNIINDSYYSDNIYQMEKENWTKHKKNKKKINEIYNTKKKQKKNIFIHFFIILFYLGKNILQNIKYRINYIFIKIVYFFHIHKLYTFPIYKDDRKKKKKMYTQSFEMNVHNIRNKQIFDYSDEQNRNILKLDYDQGGEIHRLNSLHFQDNEHNISSNIFLKHMYHSNNVYIDKSFNMSNNEKTKQNNNNKRNLFMCAKSVIRRNIRLAVSKKEDIQTNKKENYSNDVVDNKSEPSDEQYEKANDIKMNHPTNKTYDNNDNNNDNIIWGDIKNNSNYYKTQKHNNIHLSNKNENDNMVNEYSHNNDKDVTKKYCHGLTYKNDNKNYNNHMVSQNNNDTFISDKNKCNPFFVKPLYEDEKYKKIDYHFNQLNGNNYDEQNSKNLKNKKNINNLQNMNKIKDMKKKLFKEHLNSLKLSFPEYSGIIRLSLMLICIYIFSFVDTSRIYHYIRAQPFMKLYVVLNMLEILERLLRSLGKDLIDNMIRTFIRIINLKSYIFILRNNYKENASINNNYNNNNNNSNHINYVDNEKYRLNSFIYKKEENNNELTTFDNNRRHINLFTNKSRENIFNNNYMDYIYRDSVIKNKHEYENGYVTNIDKDIFSNNYCINNKRDHADSFYYQNEINSFNLNKNKENNVRFFNNENDKKKNNESKISILFPFYSIILKFTIQYIFVLMYILIHAFMHLVRFLSLNIAINSSESTMFLILVMSNFTEIKSTVFKKFTKISLFTIVASDAVERFYLFIDAFLVLLKMSTAYRTQNSFISISSWLIIILLLEVGVDWCKHSYLLKYNKLNSESLNKYFHTLLADVLISRTPNKNIYYMKDSFSVPCKNIFCFSHIPTRRLGYMSMPVVTLIVCSLPRLNYLSNISLFSFALSIWVCLFLFKIILSIMIVSYTISEKKHLKNLRKPYDDISAL
ncbi:cyclic amine resistance locus protein [Plasmodium sp. gorilla clade G2]|nr:cyclic amine resistance locus protein [Plasmodium sp. gorilla clade G2]SOV11044.1 cyclic amine resistance locus protein [Plasmodium sp. gorilla clade G2]